MNTVHPVILMALLVDLGDFELASEAVWKIDDYLNSHPAEEEDDASGEAAGDPPPAEGDSSTSQEFQFFKIFTDVQQVDTDEEWQVPLAGSDKSVWDHMRDAWEPFAVFKSTFFTARMSAKREQRKLSAEVVFLRRDNKVSILSWREYTP
jgi:hypothetical protein